MASRARGKRAASPAAPAAPVADARTRTGGRATRLVEALHAHEHRTAAGLFALLVVVYLWPALVAGGVLSPGALLHMWTPWNQSTPPGTARYLNELLTDVPMSYYPWDVLGRELLHSGTFPAWNPHALAGTPLFANLSVAWLSPFSLPLWTLPLEYALGLSAALKLWTAAFGTYLLVRELRLGFWPGVLAGTCFALCAFNVVWLSHQAHVSVAVLLPWALWLTERLVRRGGRAEGVALALVVAAALAGGHPGTQLHILVATVLYALVRAGTAPQVTWAERGRRLAPVAGAMVLGALLMAVVLVPGVAATADTIGSDVRRGGGDGSLIGAALPFESLRAALFPDWWGRPSEQIEAGPLNYNERALYVGAVALVLALLALVTPGAWRRKAAFLPLLAIGLLVPFDVPPFGDLVNALPGFDRVQNQRLLLWFAFAAAMLAALGLDALLREPRLLRRAWAVLGAAALAAVLAIGSIDLAPGDVGAAFSRLTDRFATREPGALALSSALRWLLPIAAVAAIGALFARTRRAGLAGGLLALIAALDMLAFANAYQPMGPASVTLPGPTPVVSFLQQRSDEGRVVGLDYAVTSDWSTTYGLRDARGYDAPQPSRRYFRLWRALEGTQLGWMPLNVSSLSPAGTAVLSLLGARWIVAAPGVLLPDPPERGPLSYAYRADDATVIENARAAPRASVAEAVEVAGEEDEELAAVTVPTFDPRRTVVVRGDEVGDAAPAGTAGTVRVIAEENSRVTLRARLARPGVVVLNDAWAPGWSVTVDGAPARALQANVVMRGVAVAAGAHEIAWSYRVPGLRLGLALSALGLLALLAWSGWLLAARRRRAAR